MLKATLDPLLCPQLPKSPGIIAPEQWLWRMGQKKGHPVEITTLLPLAQAQPCAVTTIYGHGHFWNNQFKVPKKMGCNGLQGGSTALQCLLQCVFFRLAATASCCIRYFQKPLLSGVMSARKSGCSL